MLIECPKHGKIEQSGCYEKCKICNKDHVRKNRYSLKIRAILHKGGKCQKCGYDKCIYALEFHHRDPQTKSFGITSKIRSWKSVEEELEKCDLLCANCHREVSHPKYFEEQKDWKNSYQNDANKRKTKDRSSTCECGQYKSFYAKKCSSCSLVAIRAITPPKEILEELIWVKPLTRVAEELKVSISTVKRWIKKYELEQPPPGFWVTKNRIKEPRFYETKCKCGSQKSKCSILCKSCRNITSRKVVNRPTKEELQALIWSKPVEHIAADYGVTGNSVKKWIAAYGLEKPPIGYWIKKENKRTDQ